MRAEIALMSGSAFAVTHHAFSSGAGRTSDGNGSHASTLKSPSYTKSVSWQHYLYFSFINPVFFTESIYQYPVHTLLKKIIYTEWVIMRLIYHNIRCPHRLRGSESVFTPSPAKEHVLPHQNRSKSFWYVLRMWMTMHRNERPGLSGKNHRVIYENRTNW